MGKFIVFLVIAYVVAVATSTTFGGMIHLMPVAGAAVGIYTYWKLKNEPPRKPDQHKVVKSRTTWSA